MTDRGASSVLSQRIVTSQCSENPSMYLELLFECTQVLHQVVQADFRTYKALCITIFRVSKEAPLSYEYMLATSLGV